MNEVKTFLNLGGVGRLEDSGGSGNFGNSKNAKGSGDSEESGGWGGSGKLENRGKASYVKKD